MPVKPDQLRVRKLIQETILRLCQQGLTFQTELIVEGVIAVTVDGSDVFITHINDIYPNDDRRGMKRHHSCETRKESIDDDIEVDLEELPTPRETFSSLVPCAHSPQQGNHGTKRQRHPSAQLSESLRSKTCTSSVDSSRFLCQSPMRGPPPGNPTSSQTFESPRSKVATSNTNGGASCSNFRRVHSDDVVVLSSPFKEPRSRTPVKSSQLDVMIVEDDQDDVVIVGCGGYDVPSSPKRERPVSRQQVQQVSPSQQERVQKVRQVSPARQHSQQVRHAQYMQKDAPVPQLQHVHQSAPVRQTQHVPGRNVRDVPVRHSQQYESDVDEERNVLLENYNNRASVVDLYANPIVMTTASACTTVTSSSASFQTMRNVSKNVSLNANAPAIVTDKSAVQSTDAPVTWMVYSNVGSVPMPTATVFRPINTVTSSGIDPMSTSTAVNCTQLPPGPESAISLGITQTPVYAVDDYSVYLSSNTPSDNMTHNSCTPIKIMRNSLMPNDGSYTLSQSNVVALPKEIYSMVDNNPLHRSFVSIAPPPSLANNSFPALPFPDHQNSQELGTNEQNHNVQNMTLNVAGVCSLTPTDFNRVMSTSVNTIYPALEYDLTSSVNVAKFTSDMRVRGDGCLWNVDPTRLGQKSNLNPCVPTLMLSGVNPVASSATDIIVNGRNAVIGSIASCNKDDVGAAALEAIVKRSKLFLLGDETRRQVEVTPKPVISFSDVECGLRKQSMVDKRQTVAPLGDTSQRLTDEMCSSDDLPAPVVYTDNAENSADMNAMDVRLSLVKDEDEVNEDGFFITPFKCKFPGCVGSYVDNVQLANHYSVMHNVECTKIKSRSMTS